MIGRSRECAVRLMHPSISRRHACLTLQSGGVSIEDLGSRFGTFINGSHIQRAVAKPGDRLRFGSSPCYRLQGTTLSPDMDAEGLALSLLDVGVIRGGRSLVNGVNLEIAADSFVGVLGPSGAGKSLLLGCLSSAALPEAGRILFDEGKDIREYMEYYRTRVGVVTQDDRVYDFLTVEENLLYAGNLRLPSLPPDQFKHRMAEVLTAVDLAEHRSKRVAVLSGGQRKRVSVAIELLLQPRLLLLDEPTSGLDPGMQARLMEILRGLARRGITVVCSTHTMDTLHYFDAVAVLGIRQNVAELAYAGDPANLLPSFGVANPADLFDLLKDMGQRRFHPTTSMDTVEPDRSAGARRERRGPISPQIDTPLNVIGSQIGVVFQRSLLGLWRDRSTLILAAAQPVILGGLIVLSQSRQAYSTFIHFFLMVAALWMGMTLTVREIVKERPLYVRDRLAGLKPDAYFLGKAVGAFPVCALQTLLLLTTTRLLIQILPLDETTYSYLVAVSVWFAGLTIMLTAFAGSILGLLLSALANTERSAVAMLPLALLPQVLLSRVAYGDGSRSWDWPSPYQAVADWPHSVADMNWVDRILSLISLPLLTRPSTSTVDMYAHDYNWYVVAVELLYLILLLLVYLGSAYGIFRKSERIWPAMRE